MSDTQTQLIKKLVNSSEKFIIKINKKTRL